MKVSVALEVLFLFATLVWPCVEAIYVILACSMDSMMVQVIPRVYNRHVYVFADEFYLGSGCPATRIQTYEYHFMYPVYDCGIRTQVVTSEDNLRFQTELYYNPRNIHCVCHSIPLECCTSRKSGWLTTVSTDNEMKLDSNSPFIADFEATPEELGLLSSN